MQRPAIQLLIVICFAFASPSSLMASHDFLISEQTDEPNFTNAYQIKLLKNRLTELKKASIKSEKKITYQQLDEETENSLKTISELIDDSDNKILELKQTKGSPRAEILTDITNYLTELDYQVRLLNKNI